MPCTREPCMCLFSSFFSCVVGVFFSSRVYIFLQSTSISFAQHVLLPLYSHSFGATLYLCLSFFAVLALLSFVHFSFHFNQPFRTYSLLSFFPIHFFIEFNVQSHSIVNATFLSVFRSVFWTRLKIVYFTCLTYDRVMSPTHILHSAVTLAMCMCMCACVSHTFVGTLNVVVALVLNTHLIRCVFHSVCFLDWFELFR